MGRSPRSFFGRKRPLAEAGPDQARRTFLKQAMWLGAGVAASFTVLPRLARAAGGGSAMTALVQATNKACWPPNDLFQPQLIECDWYGCSFTLYQPEAIVELVGTPWNSLFLKDSTTTPSAAGLLGVRTDNPAQTQGFTPHENFEAHVWGLSDDMRKYLCVGAYCIMCKESEVDAQGDTSNWAAKRAEKGSAVDAPQFGCPAYTAGSSEVLKKFLGQINNNDMPLLYASEMDEMNWRLGCQDLALATATAPASAWACAAIGLGDTVVTPISQLLGNSGSAGGLVQSGLNDLNSNDICVGDWGPVYPRQMVQMGTAPSVGMSLAAFRALRIAHTTVGSLKPIVDTTCYLQPFYPSLSSTPPVGPKGFLIGAPSAEVDAIMSPYLAAQTALNDSRMGFVLWVPTGCWTSYEQMEDCYNS